MPAEIRYKNSVIATVAAGESKFLDCYGKKMASNVVVTLPEGYVIPKGSLIITANGIHDVTDKASVAVNVPIPDGYIKPSGSVTITENSTVDVTDKASVTVAVEGEVIPEYTEAEDFTIMVSGLEGEVEVSYDVSEKVALPSGHNLLASVSDENFIADNIKSGVTIFGVTGTMKRYGGEVR